MRKKDENSSKRSITCVKILKIDIRSKHCKKKRKRNTKEKENYDQELFKLIKLLQ